VYYGSAGNRGFRWKHGKPLDRFPITRKAPGSPGGFAVNLCYPEAMPFLLIGILTNYTLLLALERPEIFREAWLYALAYYVVTACGDIWTTWQGLRQGFREANPLYARALAMTPWGIFLVDPVLISLKAVFLQRMVEPLAVYPVAFAIAGHGHLAGFLWNLGALLDKASPTNQPRMPIDQDKR